MNSNEILDREYLEIRAKILQLAASFDRLDRSDGDVNDDSRMQTIRTGLEILAAMEDGRAKQVQMLFSREYQENWIEDYDLQARF